MKQTMKKLKKSRTLLLLLILGLIVLAVSRIPSGGDLSSVTVVEQVLETRAASGSLSMQLPAAGTIAETEAQPVSLPGAVKIDRWLVENGDYVQAGQALATLVPASVNAAVVTVNDAISRLDAELEQTRLHAVDGQLRAGAAGRVAAVYVQPGDSVPDVMEEHGCLMLLSLDGLLAADLQAEGLLVGDKLHVQRQDGSLLDAQVSKVANGLVTVTVSDAAASLGERVTVLQESRPLGEAVLYLHRAMRVDGYWGTVSYVNVKVGDAVRSGQTLLGLGDTAYPGRRQQLLEERDMLEQQLQRLLAASRSGMLTAEWDGRISGIEKTEDNLLHQSSALTPAAHYDDGTSSFRPLTAALQPEGQSGGFVLLSQTETPTDPAPEPDPESPTPPAGEPVKRSVYARITAVDAAGISLSVLNTTETLLLPPESLRGLDSRYLTVGTVLELHYENEVLVSVSSLSGGDSALSPDDMGGMGGSDLGGGVGGFSLDAASAADTAAISYPVQETVFCSITRYDQAELQLSVDQRDVAAYTLNAPVRVTLDALPGQEFTGTVTQIDPVGSTASDNSNSSSGSGFSFFGGSSSSGGSPRFTVTVTMERTAEMLSGMNCNVYLNTGEHSGLLIPVAALQEDEHGSFVYTRYEASRDKLSEPVYVETGLSDGEQVLITDGLTEGQTLYYRYADTLQYRFLNS